MHKSFIELCANVNFSFIYNVSAKYFPLKVLLKYSNIFKLVCVDVLFCGELSMLTVTDMKNNVTLEN